MKKDTLDFIFQLVIGITASFWKSAVTITWGVAGMLILVIQLKSLEVTPQSIEQLKLLISFLQNNWKLFWFAFFTSEFYSHAKNMRDDVNVGSHE